MKNEIELIPTYWANVSGGKDSLYMLRYLLQFPELYPLDGVVHFELEIDYPFIKNVIDYMESECNRKGIAFVRIKPRKTWVEWYNTISSRTGNIYGFPTRKTRWCNSRYKLDAEIQLETYMKSIGRRVVHYIGYCANEQNRIKKHGDCDKYPLADAGIEEQTILEWAREQPIFNDFYKYNDRCGCMYCPMSSYKNFAYLAKYYPEHFKFMIDKMRETETIRESELGRPFSCIQSNPKYNADYLEHIVYTKYIPKMFGDND